MADKTRFAQIIEERLAALDRSAGWLARTVGTSEANVSRWRDDTVTTMPRDPEMVHRLAAALEMSEPLKQQFFEAADLVYRPATPKAQPTTAAPQLDPVQVAAYLEAVRNQCGRAETRPYRQLSEQRGAPPRLSLLDEKERCGVYEPLRFDLHSTRADGEILETTLPKRKTVRNPAALDAPRTNISLAEVLASPGHVALIGAAGCGKTTVLRWVATHMALSDRDQARRELGLTFDPVPLPVYIALRDFEHVCANEPKRYQRDTESLLRFLDDHFARWHPGRVPRGFLSGLVRAGRAWLLLDALDEVADYGHRITVRQVIEHLAHEFPDNRLLVTARVAAYMGANTRLDERFQVVMVRDLTPKEWEPMVKRLYIGLEPDADAAAERSRRLLSRIAAEPLLQAMVKTPLMVWTATLIHYADRELPEQRAELYRAYVDVLLGERLHEEQGAEAAQHLRDDRWSMDERLLYLANAAYQAHQGAERDRDNRGRDAVVVVDEEDLVKRILAPFIIENRMLAGEKRQVQRQAEEEAKAFLAFMAERSGLLYAHPGGYSFGDHLTVQEFLAAKYLVDNVRGTSDWHAFLQARAGQSWWLETFLLMVGYLLEKPEQARRLLMDELGKLPGEGDAAAYGLAWAGRALLEIPPRRVGWHAGVRDELARRLVRVLWQNPPATSVAARVETGDVLGRLGDPRFSGEFLLPEFITISADTLSMDSDETEVDRLIKKAEESWFKRELSRHQVELNTFALARFPTTNAMFRRFMEADGYADERWWDEAIADRRWAKSKVRDYQSKREQLSYRDGTLLSSLNQPVVGVTWYEAVAYCRWLTAALNDGTVYRLPTEAEWERAARGPKPSALAHREDARIGRYPWGDSWAEGCCNSKELGLGRATPVGIFPQGASVEGVLDLAGNVWEWCGIAYAEYPYDLDDDQGDLKKVEYRILRGGSWYTDRTGVLCAIRIKSGPDDRSGGFGFRVARSPR